MGQRYKRPCEKERQNQRAPYAAAVFFYPVLRFPAAYKHKGNRRQKQHDAQEKQIHLLRSQYLNGSPQYKGFRQNEGIADRIQHLLISRRKKLSPQKTRLSK